MNPDLKKVTRDHVGRACALFDSGSAVPARQVHSLVVLIEGRQYPANFVLQVAQSLANGSAKHARPAPVTGAQTIKFFRDLGMEIHKGPLQFITAGRERPTPSETLLTTVGTNGKKRKLP